MESKHGKSVKSIRYLIIASLLLSFMCLAAWAALLPAERFSNAGAVQGQADGLTPGGDRHNSYAWTMETMKNSAGEEYLYVGSNRDLLYLIPTQSGISIDIEEVFSGDVAAPESGDLRARIFRKKLGGDGDWETIYTSGMLNTDWPEDLGYRGVVSYAAPGEDRPSLYFGSMGVMTRLLKIGPDFDPEVDEPQVVFQTAPGSASSLRPITVYNKKLYLGVLTVNDNEASADLQVLESETPDENGSWAPVADKRDFPGARMTPIATNYGGIWDMISFNGWLYAFVGSNYTGATDDGFMVFKGKPVGEGTPGRNDYGWLWEMVVGDKSKGARYLYGAGNNSNVTATPFLYSVGGKDYVYVGTFADVISPLSMVTSGDLTALTSSLTPCQVYRFDKNDNWEMIIGNTQDSHGEFTERKGNYGAGFFNPPADMGGIPAGMSLRDLSMNQYAWRMGVYNGKLYVTTFDAGVILDYLRNFVTTDAEKEAIDQIVNAIREYNTNPSGFDLYSTSDGVNFSAVTVNGFGDKFNYGGRTVKATGDAIYIGTANPFYGGQVWKLSEEHHGGSSGCSAAGVYPLALLLIVPMFLRKRR
ncbi:MAG: SYNERG-CTERM sorting domain-containing protein [Synergistaceae bacterium]|nr:SYNERG-CTERM sorting domain-containing protein [Synergistaceae bacterium]